MEAGSTTLPTDTADAEPVRAAEWPPRAVWKWLSDCALRPATRKLAMSLIDQAAVSGTSFVTSVLIGRLCSQSDLGVYYLALSIVFFVRGIQEQLVWAPYMIYSNRRAANELAAYGGSTLAHHLILSGITILGLSGFIVALAWGYGPEKLAATAWVLPAAAPLMLLREFVRHIAFARFQSLQALAVDVAVAVVQLAALALLAWFDLLSVPAVYAVMGGACALACGAWFVLGCEPLKIRWPQVLPDWRHNWGFARWALASQLIGSTSLYVMPWLVAVVQNEAETGLLAACTSLVGLANMFVIGVCNYLSPKAAHAFASGGVTALQRVLWRTAALFATVLGSFCLVVLFTGDTIAVLVYGDAFRGCGTILLIASLAMFVESMNVTAGNGLWAIEKPSANFAADVVSLVTCMGISLLLIGPYGATGAAIASLSSAVVSTLVRSLTLYRLMSRRQLAA